MGTHLREPEHRPGGTEPDPVRDLVYAESDVPGDMTLTQWRRARPAAAANRAGRRRGLRALGRRAASRDTGAAATVGGMATVDHAARADA